MQTQTVDDDYLVRPNELQKLFGVDYHKGTLRRLEKEGKFPKRIFITPQRVAWRAGSIRQWIAGLEASNHSGEARDHGNA